jgi:hypothetical protein
LRVPAGAVGSNRDGAVLSVTLGAALERESCDVARRD